MKLLHISDLHIGKKLKGYSLIEDQEFILEQIIDTAKSNNVKGIIIAGDIYDITIPSTEAINLFDDFITKLNSENIACYAVCGNHDSVHRVTFGSKIMSKGNIFFAKKYSGTITPIEIERNINLWLLPFIRPMDIREYHPDFENSSYEEMMQNVIKNLDIDTTKTNILVAHQFITSNGKQPERSESESVSLGTLENIDASNFDDFDYVALGHIHKSQSMGRDEVRYGGSPLKYSFSEKDDKKSMVVIDINKKDIAIDKIPYKPLKDMKEIRGKFEDLIKEKPSDDYIKVILTDDNYITDVKNRFETIFPNVMEIIYDNVSTRENQEIGIIDNFETYKPIDLFKRFYQLQHNQELNSEQEKIISDIFEELNMEVE